MHIFSDKRCRRIGAYFLFFSMVIALLRSPQQVFADPASGTGTISGVNVYVRNEPGIEGTIMLVAVDTGQQVNIIGETTVDGKTWYQVTCTVGDTSYTGWTYGMYVSVNDSDTTSSAGTASNSAGTGTDSVGTTGSSTGTDTSSANNAGAQEPSESEAAEPEGTVKEFTVNGYVLHPADTIPEAIIPVGFSEDTITIDGAEYPCLSFSDGEMKFLYLLEEGETSGQLYLYDDLRDEVYPFIQLESKSGYLIAALPGGQQLLGSFFQDGGTYQFDTTVSAYPRYVFSSTQETAEDTAEEQQNQLEQDYAKLETAYNELVQKDSRMMYIDLGIIGVLLVVIIILIATRGKAKPDGTNGFEDEDDWDKEDWDKEDASGEVENSEETVVEETGEEETVEEELPAIDIAAVAEESPEEEEVSAEKIAAAPEIHEDEIPEAEIPEEEIPKEETAAAEEEPAEEIQTEETVATPELPAEETVAAPELPADDDDLVFIDL
jgi:hypothetical protein